MPAEGDPFAAGLGGTEQAIVHLSTALAARGHAVSVMGGATTERTLDGVHWLPAGPVPPADVTVAINAATLLPPSPSLPVVWFHNEVEFLREWRKGRLPALRRYRPAAIFIGQAQTAAASRLLPFRARATIPYGLADQVLTALPAPETPGPHAVFTSQAYRGLSRVIALWRGNVAPFVPAARLSAYIAPQDVEQYAALAADVPSIGIHPRIGNAAVLEMLRTARVLIAPGHRSETFCMAAAEAIAMGVPVLTLGIGSLKERVADGRTGFVVGNWRDLAARALDLLTNDALWTAQHAAGLATRADAGWDRAARQWEHFASEHVTKSVAA